jgi:hypothetical protein
MLGHDHHLADEGFDAVGDGCRVDGVAVHLMRGHTLAQVHIVRCRGVSYLVGHHVVALHGHTIPSIIFVHPRHVAFHRVLTGLV